MASCGVDEHARAHDVGLEEHGGSGNGPVDVALCREVDHDIVPGDHAIYEVGIADVPLHEGVVPEIVQLRHGRRHAGVGHGVEVGHRAVRLGGEDAPDEVRPDEAGPAGDEISTGHVRPPRVESQVSLGFGPVRRGRKRPANSRRSAGMPACERSGRSVVKWGL